MEKDYIIENGKFGKKFILLARWDKKYIDIIKNNEIKELELNYAKGWEITDLSFLSYFCILESLTLISHHLDDISPIHNLHSLKQLSIDDYSNAEIDFSQFPYLQDCRLEWRPKAKSIFKCKTLKTIYIQNYKSNNLDSFVNLENLEELTIGSSPIQDLSQLKKLTRLNKLCLYLCRKLTHLAGIETLGKLKELEINSSKNFYEINEIGELINLQKLQLCTDGKIKTLDPLKNLKKLESFFFYEDTNIEDGNLNILWEMDNLKDLAFQNRKHYSHTREQFYKKLGINF